MREREGGQSIEKDGPSSDTGIGHKRFWQRIALVAAGITVGLLLLKSIF